VALRAKKKLTARKLLAGGFSKDGARVSTLAFASTAAIS
jgi:hypothetical protein